MSETENRPFGATEQLAVWVLLISAFVVILNETIMGVALPKLMADLHVSAVAGQWLTTAFLLTMSIVIPITGMLIQRVKTRHLFTIAMSLFSAGTLIAATAPGFEMLLVGRVVQAGGTAIMMPLLMTTVVTLVPEHQRGRLMGRIAIVISVAPALGPTISGIILQSLSWRWLFIIMLPIALGALVFGLIRMPNVGEQSHAKIDIFSVMLSVFAFGGIIYGLSLVGESANGDALIPAWIPLVVGVLALGVFVWRQLVLQREDRALLDLRTFKSRPFALSVLLFIFSSMALFGSLILLPIYAQSVLGYNTLQTGLMLLPGGLLMGLLGPIVGRMVDARGSQFILIPGTLITALAMWSMGLFTESTTIWQILATHLALSVGLAGVFTPLFSVSLGSLPTKLASHGSATLSTAQQVAGAAGTALFITVMTLVSVSAAGSPSAVDPHDLALGTRAAFILGGAVATIGFVVSFFVRDPAPVADPALIEAPVAK
ncbi:DHA2 family lincomycin resistance protein-like MFS transporter [Leucobacter exalbidus]|uniref:DHA2 family lincomycin resistance protein-like MFS transporter n=1 Tax=Leucobacter exalbidus TaxID=662960 RepID=A0A940T2H1_9MICO|nr:DHA2 family efflux MFS transporter permease subunit [Leucobacter exalbidus]MBP1324798.1 DHA2 family lincomycin resistance protein-like MFS transporter [Leucobacter exalbidus]